MSAGHPTKARAPSAHPLPPSHTPTTTPPLTPPQGSFGTFPRTVRDTLRSFQDASEARPDPFIRYTYPKALDASRAALAPILNAPVDTLVFVPNATTGINTILRSLVFNPGDTILYFATIYGACEKTVEYITETTPASAVKVQYTYPISNDALLSLFLSAIAAEQSAGRTVKIAIFDTIASLPGVRMPFERLTAACRAAGILSCIDGAHAVGHIPLDLGRLDPDFFVSNCHKWLFVPRGCAVLYVPVRNQALIRSTLPTSHGFVPKPKSVEGEGESEEIINPLPTKEGKSAYVTGFEFVGTVDSAPYLCVSAALEYRRSLGGEDAVMKYCHGLARKAGKLVAERLGTRVMENEEGTLGACCFSNVALPLDLEGLKGLGEGRGERVADAELGIKVRDWLTLRMVEEYDTFMALIFYDNVWWVRLSAQVYLDLDDFERGAEILKKLCDRVKEGGFLQEAASAT